MGLLNKVSILLCVTLTMTQKPPYAGRPVPGLLPAFRPNQTDVGNRVNLEQTTTTTTLPPELQGTLEEDKLVQRVSEWPEDKQPFWFKNREAISANRERPVDGQPSQPSDQTSIKETEKRGNFGSSHYHQPTKYDFHESHYYHAKEQKQQEFNRYVQTQKQIEDKRIQSQQQKELEVYLEQQKQLEEAKLKEEKEIELQKFLEAQKSIVEERLKEQQEKELKEYLEKQKLIEEQRLKEEKDKKLEEYVQSIKKTHEQKSKEEAHKYHHHSYHHPSPIPPPPAKITYPHYPHPHHW